MEFLCERLTLTVVFISHYIAGLFCRFFWIILIVDGMLGVVDWMKECGKLIFHSICNIIIKFLYVLFISILVLGFLHSSIIIFCLIFILKFVCSLWEIRIIACGEMVSEKTTIFKTEWSLLTLKIISIAMKIRLQGGTSEFVCWKSKSLKKYKRGCLLGSYGMSNSS